MNEVKTASQVVVIGAGYAGLLATVRLAGKLQRSRALRARPVKITLVNASDLFVERLRLHEFAANRVVKPRPLESYLKGTGVQFVQGYVSHLDADRHILKVETKAGNHHISYDKLLFALGSLTDRNSVSGVDQYAYTLTPVGPLSAVELREQLPIFNAKGGRLVVCGGGATGIEAAAEFASNYPNLKVSLLTQGVFGEFLGKAVAVYMRKALEDWGVTILDNTVVSQVKPNEVVCSTGTLGYDLCLWTGGFIAPPLAREAGLAVNERGQVLIDPFMRSVSHPDIFAVGDAAYPVEEPGAKVRMSAYTALIMGGHGADCLSATLLGQTPRPFSFAYLGQGIALGRHTAIGFGKSPDDHPHPPYFTGRVGYGIRSLFLPAFTALPAIERRWPGFFFWTGKDRYAAKRRTEKPLPSRGNAS
ncbi:MAG TPA: FAD-dependent oxidoreductase [Chloroflexia bacterium]|nr:FAD-dependent oxidoreductase [Chloroflexia bacterium]